jgi:tetratricopeptide (TPR) repeat protein
MTIYRAVNQEATKVAANVPFINEIGMGLLRKGRYTEADFHFNLALEDLEHTKRQFYSKIQYQDLSSCDDGGSYEAHTLLEDPDQAAEIFALEIWDDDDEEGNILMVAHWLCCATMAAMHNSVLASLALGQFKQAQTTLQKALSIWQREVQQGSAQLKRVFMKDASSVAHLVSLYYLSGRVLDDMAAAEKHISSEEYRRNAEAVLYHGAVEQFQRALQVGDALMATHIAGYQKTLLGTYTWLAESCKRKQDMKGATAACRRAVKAYICIGDADCDPNHVSTAAGASQSMLLNSIKNTPQFKQEQREMISHSQGLAMRA